MEVKRAKLAEKEPKTSSEDNERLLSEALSDLQASAIVDKDSEAKAKTITLSEQHSKKMLAAAAPVHMSPGGKPRTRVVRKDESMGNEEEAGNKETVSMSCGLLSDVE